jgi:hypothetical protein
MSYFRKYNGNYWEDDESTGNSYYTGGSKYFNYSYYSDYFKKLEITKPYLDYNQKNMVKTLLDKTYAGTHHHNIYSRLYNSYSDVISGEDFERAFRNIRSNFPEEVIYDIFNLYYRKIEELNFEDRSSDNKQRFSLVEAANNPFYKIITNSSTIKSSVFSKNIAHHFILKMFERYLKTLKHEDKKTADKDLQQTLDNLKSKSSGGGKGSDNKSKKNDSQKSNKQPGEAGSGGQGAGEDDGQLSDAQQALIDALASKADMEKIMDQSQIECSMIDSMFSEEDLLKFGTDDERLALKLAAKLDPEILKQALRELERINIDSNAIKTAVRNIVSCGQKYFSKKDRVYYEDIHTTDNLSDIVDSELLHPKVRNILLDDIMFKNFTGKQTIDLYIDKSGSMSSRLSDQYAQITRMDFSKVMALYMKDVGLLAEVYPFTGNINGKLEDNIDILLLNASGGTSISTVIKEIDKKRKNSIVITDGDDHISVYSEFTFFLGLPGCSFNNMISDKELYKKYTDNKQIMFYDGKDITYVR